MSKNVRNHYGEHQKIDVKTDVFSNSAITCLLENIPVLQHLTSYLNAVIDKRLLTVLRTSPVIFVSFPPPQETL